MNGLIQLVMILRVIMIWTQNYFWYMPDQTGWLSFVVVYQLLANFVPISVFILVSAEQIKNAFVERKLVKLTEGSTVDTKSFQDNSGSPRRSSVVDMQITESSFLSNYQSETVFGLTAIQPMSTFSRVFILREE